jgi:glycosyltransferase involved in cell wall biosynthesis
MTTPLLSICIATYNRADYIGETLDSIIPQLTDNVELLVVDGASTDNTEDVVRTYTDPRIRYVRLPLSLPGVNFAGFLPMTTCSGLAQSLPFYPVSAKAMAW